MAQNAQVESDYFALKDISKDVLYKMMTLFERMEESGHE